MGAELAVVATGAAQLQNFNDEVVAKIHLTKHRDWILMASVDVLNADSDRQWATVKLVHDVNIVITEVKGYIDFIDDWCVYLQAAFRLEEEGEAVITLECNTYNGAASYGSLIALRVDDIDFQ